MISLEWVKDYIDIADQDLNELAVKITKAGINVEKVITNHIDNLVIGEVLECENHPDSDHLHVCQVKVKDGVNQIVCGAHNVRKGIKVIVALPGAKLPEFEIKPTKIRGIESNGMICALFELGLKEKTEEEYNKGIEELDSKASVGEDALKYLGYDDTLYELDIHKHRNNDCYSHIGFAYEIGSILGREVKMPDLTFNEINEEKLMNLEVKTNKCPYYLGRIVKDVKIKESPDFIKKRLTNAGMRPINNVVDISNYVMLEFGQPLHFFDYDKLGSKVLVRDALDNEKIITLDGKERILTKEDVVITDSKKPVCIAGVMGGENTEVDENTKTIFIESAIFDATSIRYTSSKLNLRSEASIRYGKGLNYEYTDMAIARACNLLEKYADAKVLKTFVKYDKVDKKDKIVKFTETEVSKMLGIKLTQKDIETELKRLSFPYKLNKDIFEVNIPKRRLDIDPNINDIVEEIGRLYGYDNLVSTLPKVETKRGSYIGDVKLRKQVSKRLRSLGLNECKTYTLISPDLDKMFRYDVKESIILPNPMSLDKSVIRNSLISSLYSVYEYNKSHKIKDVLIYEIAKTYDVNLEEDLKVSMLLEGNYLYNTWSKSSKVDFYLVKGIVEDLLNYLGFKNRYTFAEANISDMHPGICAKILLDREEIGVIGKINPKINKDDIYLCEISLSKLLSKDIKNIKYKELQKYPSIEKDMAFIVDKNVTSEEMIKVIKKKGSRLLTDVKVFDVYSGENIDENSKSIAYNLTFNDPNKTLTDEEVNLIFENIIKEVENSFKATLRNK